jgi:hypothetical protein
MTPFNSTNSSPTHDRAALPCSVVYAGDAVMLLVPAREGRFPVEITTLTEPLIGWRSKDGLDEHIELVGDTRSGDFAALLADLHTDGLLVAEVPDTTVPDLDAAEHWLMQAPSCTSTHFESDR